MCITQVHDDDEYEYEIIISANEQTLNNKIDELQRALQVEKSNVERCTASLADNEDEMNELRSTVGTLQSELHDSHTEMSQLNKLNDAKSKELEQYAEAAEWYQRDNNALQDEVSTLQTEIRNLQLKLLKNAAESSRTFQNVPRSEPQSSTTASEPPGVRQTSTPLAPPPAPAQLAPPSVRPPLAPPVALNPQKPPLPPPVKAVARQPQSEQSDQQLLTNIEQEIRTFEQPRPASEPARRSSLDSGLKSSLRSSVSPVSERKSERIEGYSVIDEGSDVLSFRQPPMARDKPRKTVSIQEPAESSRTQYYVKPISQQDIYDSVIMEDLEHSTEPYELDDDVFDVSSNNV